MDHDELLWREEAVDRVLDLRETMLADHATESVGLDAVGDRVLAESITAETDAPPVSRATMDGFAVNAADEYPLTVREGEVFPEDDPGEIDRGETQRIATGAPLPRGADAVLKREEATVADGELTGASVEAGTYVYEQGRNYGAGETLFAAGERLGPRDAILLGDMGLDSVSVRARFSVGVVATGTEIHEGRSRDLDSPMLAGLIESWGHTAAFEGSAPDEYERVRDLLAETASEYDVVVSTGGTSVGHKDHVIRALDELGDVLFHKVRIRPGKPIAVADLPDHDAVAVAIPGKPIGAHVVAAFVMAPLFTGMDGPYPTVTAACSTDVGLGPEGFEYVIPVTLDAGVAQPLGHADSPLSVYSDTFDPSVLSSSTRTTRADGVVCTTDPLTEGETVSVIPYDVLE
ncbi:MAG: molybdopterin molybdotransferase MoeA [Halobacteriaceae archaeon]